jgi:hypothetical protein
MYIISIDKGLHTDLCKKYYFKINTFEINVVTENSTHISCEIYMKLLLTTSQVINHLHNMSLPETTPPKKNHIRNGILNLWKGNQCEKKTYLTNSSTNSVLQQ